jgi:hypothetical protein
VRNILAACVLAGLSGCASLAPLEEQERARVVLVAPAAAQFAPDIEFKVPPGRVMGAAAASGSAAGSAAYLCLLYPAAYPACVAVLAPAGLVIGLGVAGAAATPSNEGLEPMIQRARGRLGASDVQQLLLQRFSEGTARLTPHRIVPDAGRLGPRSPTDAPSYAAAVAGDTMVVELAVESVSATLVEPIEFFGADYASRPLRIALRARMRLVRASDGTSLMTRRYLAARYAGRVQEYDHDAASILRVVANAVEEVAMLMVDDAFLLRSDTAGFGARAPAVTALEPLPSGTCLALAYDCWAFNRVPRLDTLSPRFLWRPFPEPGHLEAAPWLRSTRKPVYDLWIFGGEDDRIVEGLASSEYTLERPLTPCRRYSWAVRARFDTDAGPRTVEWSTASVFPRTQLQTGIERPTFGAPFITPCP